MPEEREISPLWIIPIGIILGVGAGLGLLVALAREKEAPPEEAPPEEGPPEEGPPVVIANIFGIVTHAETGTPLAGVSVELWSPDGLKLLLSTSTDSAGNYAMVNILLGNYLIRFEKEGHQTILSDIALVEGDNDLNVEMVSIVVPPFTFSNESVRSQVCPEATAYWTAIFDCRISNPADRSITHTLTYWRQGYSHTYGVWRDPRAIESFEKTLGPGASYNYHNSGFIWVDDHWACWPPIMMHYTYYYWLEDELGNQSTKVKIYRP